MNDTRAQPVIPAWRFPLLGLDISERRIGLAIADNDVAPPQAVMTYARITRARDLAQCADWIRRYGIGGVVIGLPLHMDGGEGPRARWMRRFAGELQTRLEVPVILQDERLSTVEAVEALSARGYDAETVAERADAVAAALILRRFLAEKDGAPCG